MDNHKTNSEVISFGDGIEVEAGDSSGLLNSELVSIDGNVGHMAVMDDDFGQPDGQRSSLSLDDDGGTHFESYSQDAVMRRGGSARDVNSLSPTQQTASDDNNVVLNPAFRFQFDNDDEDDNNNTEDGLQVVSNTSDNDSAGNIDYILQRPIVNGMTGLCPGVGMTTDQGQNVRIIEGHDSSLLDDAGNSPFGFNFLQNQMLQFPNISSGNLKCGMGHTSRLENEAHNLYDSLEREDGSSLYGESDDHIMENNSSEYFSAGNMSLVVANSQVPDSDSPWAQDESSDHGSYIPHSQHNFHRGQGTDKITSRHVSPPINFQAESSNISQRRGSGFLREGNMGDYGDVLGLEEDNTDALTVELSEEGLSHCAQICTQLVSASSIQSTAATISNVSCKMDTSLFHHQPHNDWNSSKHNENQPCSFDNSTSRSVHALPLNSQLKNLDWNQGFLKDELKSGIYVDGRGIDVQADERQAGAGDYSVTNQKLTADSNQFTVRQVGSAVQTRRPAVQGSASTGDNKRSGALNPRQSSLLPRKAVPSGRSGVHTETSLVGSATESRQTGGPELGNRCSYRPSAAGNTQLKSSQNQPSAALSLAILSNSLKTNACNSSNSNSRVCGVGKEAHWTTNSQALKTQNGVPFVKAESNHHLTVTQRPDANKADISYSLMQTSHSAFGISQLAFDRVLQNQIPHSESAIPRSFSKQQSPSLYSQHLPSSGEHVIESQECRQGDHNLTPCVYDNQNFNGTGGFGPSSKNIQNHCNAQYPFTTQHLTLGPQHMHHQICASSFDIQTACSQDGHLSSSDGDHQNLRESAEVQRETFKRNGAEVVKTSDKSIPVNNGNQCVVEEVNHMQNSLGVDNSASVHTGRSHSDISAANFLFPDQSQTRPMCLDADASFFIGNNLPDDMSDILENFPTFSSKMFSDMVRVTHRSDSTSQEENQHLRDNLEKERYRRKHCEEHIQKQNAMLLEVQQQLAVAVSTDKRKDLMIDQLDKQLAKVVEGWKKKEAEKDEFLKILNQEKEYLEATVHSQLAIISNFERDLSHTVDELRDEKEKSAQMINTLKDELQAIKKEKKHVEEIRESEREKSETMITEWENLKDLKELAERNAQEAEERMKQEQDSWSKKEQKLLLQIQEMQENNLHILNMEKVKQEDQKKQQEDAEARCEELKSELKKVIQDMEHLIREKESQKVEMAIMEAKFDNGQRKLEADLHAQMEKEIADQAAEFHSQIETSLEEAVDRHRKQLEDLRSQHQQDIEQQAAMMNEERQKCEDEYRKHLSEMEEKLQEIKKENISLRQSKVKLESQRMEILTKLQLMMQSQWNEAVSLLVTTPHKKSLNNSFLSSQSGGQLTPGLAATDQNTSESSLSQPTSGMATMMTQNGENQNHETIEFSHPPPASTSTVLESVKSQKHDEVNRMDRVEEYLQRLPQNMDILRMRNDSMTKNELQAPSSRETYHIDTLEVIVPNNNYTSLDLQPQQYSSVRKMEESDFYKPSNNLGQSHSNFGYVMSQGGKSLIATIAHVDGDSMGKAMPPYQAVSMKSPQQSASKHSSVSSRHLTKAVTDLPISSNHHHILNGQPCLGVAVSHQHQGYHDHHHQQQVPKLQPEQQMHDQQSGPGHCNSRGNNIRPVTGDFGDHKEVKLTTSSANVNVYRSNTPVYTSSPTNVIANHWLSSSDITMQCCPSVSSMTSALVASPSQDKETRTYCSAESPVKRHRPRTSQQADIGIFFKGGLQESLSPPVKQKAEKDQSDTTSDTSSGRLDTNSYNYMPDPVKGYPTRQVELQHYVRMLLQKAPGSICSEPEKDLQYSDGETLESSKDLTVDLDLNETAVASELTAQLAQLQLLRQSQVSASCRNSRMQRSPCASQSTDSMLSQMSPEFSAETGVISSQRLAEISKLLDLCSTEHNSRQDDKKQRIKNSPMSQQTIKVKDMAKIHGIRNESQSADASLVANDKSTYGKAASFGPLRKGSQIMEVAKDKKAITKQIGPKTTGGPAWK